MENATKALLIAAAVLIAIVLVALGVNLLSGVGDTTDQAEQVGSAIGEGIGSASDKVTSSLMGTMTATEAKAFLQGQNGWSEALLNNLETDYGNYTFRVYENDNNENVNTFSAEGLWDKSSVINKMPSGYAYQGIRFNGTAKLCVIIIKPTNI